MIEYCSVAFSFLCFCVCYHMDWELRVVAGFLFNLRWQIQCCLQLGGHQQDRCFENSPKWLLHLVRRGKLIAVSSIAAVGWLLSSQEPITFRCSMGARFVSLSSCNIVDWFCFILLTVMYFYCCCLFVLDRLLGNIFTYAPWKLINQSARNILRFSWEVHFHYCYTTMVAHDR